MSFKSDELAKYIRLNSLKMCSRGKSSHIGSVLSCADMLAVLYSDVLNYYPIILNHPLVIALF